MGMIFGKSWQEDESSAGWNTVCKKDPRFTMSGGASGISDAAHQAHQAIKVKAKQLGLTEEQLDTLEIEVSGWKS